MNQQEWDDYHAANVACVLREHDYTSARTLADRAKMMVTVLRHIGPVPSGSQARAAIIRACCKHLDLPEYAAHSFYDSRPELNA